MSYQNKAQHLVKTAYCQYQCLLEQRARTEKALKWTSCCRKTGIVLIIGLVIALMISLLYGSEVPKPVYLSMVFTSLLSMYIWQLEFSYRLKLKIMDDGVLSYIQNYLWKTIQKTCFTPESKGESLIVKESYQALKSLINDFFLDSFSSPLSPDDEKELKQWIYNGWCVYLEVS